MTAVDRADRSGLVEFAGVIALLSGVWNSAVGISALAKDSTLSEYGGAAVADEVLFGVELSTFGWFFLIVGALQLLTGGLILARNPFGRLLGFIFATMSALTSLFVLWIYPILSLISVVFSLIIMYALSVHRDEFRRADA